MPKSMSNILAFLLLGSAQAFVSPYVSSSFRHSVSLAAGNNNNRYNIILEPSDDPKAFDSFKIGSAKVHRYSQDDAGGSDTEYIMWYHGRSVELNEENKALPPLSTGRIGRATSRNGLVWVKDKEGSASEDVSDVSLGLNKDSWWGFDTAHVGLGSVMLPMSTPAVMTADGVYLLYYMGGNGEETLVADYMDRELPEAMKDATLQGMKMKIGVALSQDGISFGRVEGDDPSGACVFPVDRSDPTQKNNPTIPDDIDEELYCGWPEVTVNVDGNPDEAFLMYYSTMLKDTKEKCIAFATSSDGFKWYKRGVCLKPGDDGLDASGCARCCVVKDAEYNVETTTWSELPSFTMYYEGVSPEDGKHRILKAVSRDGKEWKKEGVAIDVGDDEDWDCSGVGSPHMIRLDDGSSRMYYTGQGPDGSTAIGVMKCSYGTNEWVREQATISFATAE